MSRRELAAFACRVLALLMVAQGFYGVATSLFLMLGAAMLSPYHGYLREIDLWKGCLVVSPTIALFLVAAFFWKRADDIASRMVSGSSETVTLGRLPLRDVMTILFSFAGVFLFVDGFRGLVGIFSLLFLSQSRIDDVLEVSDFWAYVGQITLALWLVLGSRGILGVVERLRFGGQGRGDEGSMETAS